ncbi:MAG TPA: type III pantothenate kinase [Xanthomonadaceae bacterium]|nr:type III pantothenate kinase [Xanthomonadaceae bacterium]
MSVRSKSHVSGNAGSENADLVEGRADPTRIWLIDLGNTRLKWARADALGSGDTHAVAHAQSEQECALDIAFGAIGAGDQVWLASVASPGLTARVEAALRRRGAQVTPALTQSECAGVRIAYADPSRLGVDRFLTLLAAHARAPCAWLIASIGTALTLDLLTADGMHLGGLIVASPTLMRESLSQRASQLPVDGGSVVDFASNTPDALASGAILSARALIASTRQAAKRRLGTTPTLLISGGGADAVCSGWRVRAERVPGLVLHGLRVYAHAAGEPLLRD